MIQSIKKVFTSTWNLYNDLFRKSRKPLVIVTGSDQSHFRSALQFLASACRHEGDSTIVFYDLGLAPEAAAELRANFPAVHYRVFEFANYPAYFDIRVEAGQYAWKPAIVHAVLEEGHPLVLWMDAGCVLTGRLNSVRLLLEGNGFYSPASSGTIRDWTHPGTLTWLHAPPEIGSIDNVNGACIGFNGRRKASRRLAERWYACALEKDCIAPPGSSRANHRQDQAVLSVLVALEGMRSAIPYRLNFLTHQDVEEG